MVKKFKQPPYRIVREMRALGYKLNTRERKFEDKGGERDSVMFSEVETFVQRTKGREPEPAPREEGPEGQKRVTEERMSPRLDNLHKIAGGDVHLMRALERLRFEQKARDHAMNYGMGTKMQNAVQGEQMSMGQDAEFYTPFNISEQGGLWVELMEVDMQDRLSNQLPLSVPPAEFEEFVQKIKGRKDLQLQLLRMFFDLRRVQQTVAREREKMMALNHQIDRSMKNEHLEVEKQRLQVLNSTGHLIEALAMMVGNMPQSR